MKTTSLELLAQLTNAPSGKQERTTELLRPPELEPINDWLMHVPLSFNAALDIKQTLRVIAGKPMSTWTQGTAFAFKAGDILYDTPKAYADWSLAIQNIGLCMQVMMAEDATNARSAGARNPGVVAFDILIPSADKTRLVRTASQTLSQDAFVRFLISGDGLIKQIR